MIHKIVPTLSIAALIAFASPPAAADVTKAQCVDANTNAQSLRRDGSFAEARAMLAVCGDPQCPALVRDDCTRQLDALEQLQPTVVLDAKDRSGADRSAVRVKVDGRAVAEKLDGTPLPVDRGEHTFVFEADGEAPVTLTVVVREGEKSRRVSVTLGAVVDRGGEDRGGGHGGDGTDKPTTHGGAPAQRTLGLVAGGAGALGLGIGTIFGILAASKWSATRNDCAGPDSCPSYTQAVADHGTTVSDGTIATIALLAGGGLLATGAALFFTAPSTSADRAPTVGLGLGTLTVRGHFE
jgi:hypothetical protein